MENVIILQDELSRDYSLCKKITSDFNELIATGKIIQDQIGRDVWELITLKDSPGGDKFHILFEYDKDQDMLDTMVGFIHLWL